MTDFAKTDEDRAILKLFSTDVVIGRPFVTSPGVPAERVAILRKAFDEMMKDPAYLKDAAAAGLDVEPGRRARKSRRSSPTSSIPPTTSSPRPSSRWSPRTPSNATEMKKLHLTIATEDYDHFRDFR